MLGRCLLLAIAALAVLGLGAVIAACGDGAQPEDFVGTWREMEQDPARVLRIEEPRNGIFEVVYPRFYPAYGEFRLEDGRLTYSAVSPELVDVIEYDAGDDTITITSGSSGRVFTLERTTGGAGSAVTASESSVSLPEGWSAVTVGVGDIVALSFIDDRRGWAAGSPDGVAPGDGLWRTVDSGASWELVSDSTFIDLCFVDDRHGWAIGRGPGAGSALYASSDGGASWTKPELSDAPHNLYQVRFLDARRGFIAAGQYGKDHGGWLLATKDGGETWQPRKVTDTPISALYFLDGREGWAAGDQDVLHTTDGGRTWTRQFHRGNGALAARDAWFVDARHGWLASDLDGSIRATSDGGRTWRTSWRDTSTGIYAVRFQDADTGWAVGIRYPDDDAAVGPAKGLILSTTDGGATWQEQLTPQVPGLFDLAIVGDELVAAGHAVVLRRMIAD